MSPELYPCWFCERPVDQDYLIAGYDTFDEARLACLDCDRTIHALRDKGWLRATPPEPVGGREALLAGELYDLLEGLRVWPDDPDETVPISQVQQAINEWSARRRLALQASPPTGVSDGAVLDDQCPERCLGIVGHAGPHQTSDYEPDGLGAAWAEAEAALPEGWLFHGVELADHSMDEGGAWGPDWMASMSWPGHCEYDCDHDEAFRVTHDASPAAALRALAREQADSEPGR